MNATGKKARRESGLNRHQLHFNNHKKKSRAKIRRMRWSRKKVLP